MAFTDVIPTMCRPRRQRHTNFHYRDSTRRVFPILDAGESEVFRWWLMEAGGVVLLSFDLSHRHLQHHPVAVMNLKEFLRWRKRRAGENG